MTRDLELVSPDGRTLKFDSTNINFKDDADVKTQTALNVAGDVVGSDAVLSASDISITARIYDAQASDYPNSGEYDGYDNWGFVLEARKFTREVTPDLDGRTELRINTPFGTIVERGLVTNSDFSLDMDDETLTPNSFTMVLDFKVLNAYFKNRGD